MADVMLCLFVCVFVFKVAYFGVERCWEVEITRKSQGIRDRDMLGWCGGFKTGLQILRHVKRWSLIPLH